MGAISIRSIAKATGFSPATVSRALNGNSLVVTATRNLILKKAEELGYQNNPYVGKIMSCMRRRTNRNFKGNLGLVWFDQQPKKDFDPRVIQVRQGVMERAEELGYQINEFNRYDQSALSLRKILVNRGIRAVLIASLAHSYSKSFFRFDVSEFICVSIGWGLVHPVLHNVRFDYFQGMRMALHHAAHAFRDGIAAIWDYKTDQRAQQIVRACFVTHHPGGSSLGAKLFLNHERLSQKSTVALLRKYRVKCLIVEPGIQLPPWILDSVPERNIIHFKNPREQLCFGWIDSQNYLAGRWAIDLISVKLLDNEYGKPTNPQTWLVPPHWIKNRHPIPKPSPPGVSP